SRSDRIGKTGGPVDGQAVRPNYSVLKSTKAGPSLDIEVAESMLGQGRGKSARSAREEVRAEAVHPSALICFDQHTLWLSPTEATNVHHPIRQGHGGGKVPSVAIGQ